MQILKAILEAILKRHGIDPRADSYFLKLRIPSNSDELVIGKVGDQVLLGIQNAELSAPMLAYDYNPEGEWLPVRLEQKNGTTICSFLENGNRFTIPYRLQRFLLLQGMLAQKIRELNYLEKGVQVD